MINSLFFVHNIENFLRLPFHNGGAGNRNYGIEHFLFQLVPISKRPNSSC